jgi:hypothetical protein
MLKTQLHEEITNRKLAEQKNETMKLHLDDRKNKSVSVNCIHIDFLDNIEQLVM